MKFIALQALFMVALGHLHAQQVYKSVDKNGRVTYSEVPPAPGAENKLIADFNSSGSLPYALQQVVSRYPVTLYTTTDCGSCINARMMLTQRGIPFKELTVISNEDIIAYKKLTGDGKLPLATIAAQQLKGHDESELTKYLDAAGYPKSSTLPRHYRNPEVTSLVPKKAIEKVEKTEENKPAAVKARQTPAMNNNNPAGIQF